MKKIKQEYFSEKNIHFFTFKFINLNILIKKNIYSNHFLSNWTFKIETVNKTNVSKVEVNKIIHENYYYKIYTMFFSIFHIVL